MAVLSKMHQTSTAAVRQPVVLPKITCHRGKVKALPQRWQENRPRASAIRDGVRIVDATIRALPRRIGIEDVTVGAAISAVGMPIGRPRVLRPQHLLTAGGAWLGAD